MMNVDSTCIQVLTNAYLSTSKLTDRAGLISALSFIGDDRVYVLLLNTMTNEMEGRALGPQEARMMMWLPTSLGVLARRSDAAYHFIIEEGSWPSFWSQHRPWKREEDDELVNDQLAGLCIQALGYSERSDLDAVLESLKNRRDQGFPRQFNSAIVQAAFYQSVITQYGGFVRASNLVLNDANRSFDVFVKWIQSPEGKRWEEWSDQAGRIGRTTNSEPGK
jgi:hypothetical protein